MYGRFFEEKSKYRTGTYTEPRNSLLVLESHAFYS